MTERQAIDRIRVYVVCQWADDNYVSPCKIGVAKNPAGRLGQLQTASPFDLVIFRTICAPSRELATRIEGAFHRMMHKKRLRGEWFNMEPDQALAVLKEVVTLTINMDCHDEDATARTTLLEFAFEEGKNGSN